MNTYWKPHQAMTIRNETGRSQNINNLKYLDTEDSPSKKPGFFKKYFWWLGLFSSKQEDKNIQPKLLKQNKKVDSGDSYRSNNESQDDRNLGLIHF